MNYRIFTPVLLLLFISFNSLAQLPGLIVRPSGSAGPVVLDPNGNGLTSQNTTGFGSDDIASSEIPYKIVMPLKSEPTGDLLRGPSGFFSDIVRTFDGSGFYLFSDGTNLLCRLRIGGIVSGSKGYSVLLDTDGRFGNSGPLADPDYQAATTGNNGNPGFEYEVVLETNFRVAVYNVNTGNPVLVTSFPINTHSQVSVATTMDSGNPDYFYDFYVPYATMGLTASSMIRATATTVMSPAAAVGGPKSDIYGLSGTDYMKDWTDIILAQPGFTPAALTSAGAGIGPMRTKEPVVNGPLTPSSTTITGTWTHSPYSTITTAKIYIYIGATVIDSVNVTSGSSWSIPRTGLLNNNLITATAKAPGESISLTSNEVRVNSCTAGTHTATPTTTCSSDRGFEGTMAANASVKLYRYTSTGLALLGDDATTLYKIAYPSSTTWRYDDKNSQSGSACTGGAADIIIGSYAIIAQTAAGCESLPLNQCISGTAAPFAPKVTSPLIDGATTIKGLALPGSGVNLWINGYYKQSATAASDSSFTFTLASRLSLSDQVEINSATGNATTGSCLSSTGILTASCYVAAPVINTNSNSQVGENTQLTGTSSAGTGSVITIYNHATAAVIGTASVTATGTWTMSSPLVALNTTYVAQVTGHACGNSLSSNRAVAIRQTSSTRCGSINGPIRDTATAVSGTLTSAVANTTVTLFIDGNAAGSVVTGSTTWSIPVNTNTNNIIYPGAIITFSINEANAVEVSCGASQTVSCVPPAAPVFTPTNAAVTVGQTVNFTINSTTSGILYSLRDNADANNLGESKFGNASSMVITSFPFNAAGTYNVLMKASSLSGSGCASSSAAVVNVTAPLPLSFTSFNGKLENKTARLQWQTSFEQDILQYEIERSYSNNNFEKIGTVAAVGYSQAIQNYQFADADVRAGYVYYRIRIVDKNSSLSHYSKTILLKLSAGTTIEQIAPNPFADAVKITVSASNAEKLDVQIADITGRPVKRSQLQVAIGTKDFTITGLQHCAPGTYLIQVFNSEGTLLHKELLIKK